MKKSRLHFFKNTSMLISALGILVIIVTIIIVAYLAFSAVSSGITSGISSGNQYDQLASLKSNYTELEAEFNSSKSTFTGTHNDVVGLAYDNFRLELSRADTAITNVESALFANKPASEVDDRLSDAQAQLEVARESYNNLTETV